MNYTMVTSSTTGSDLNQQIGLPASSAGEGNTIVLFKPDDQQISATASTSNLSISTPQQQEAIDQSMIDRTTPTTSQTKQVQPKLSTNTSISSLSTVHTMSPIEASSPNYQPPSSPFDLKDLDLEQNDKINNNNPFAQQTQPPQTAQQRQHHNQQLNAAILANRSIELLSFENDHVLFKAARNGDTATISSLQRENCSLLTLDSQGATVLHHAVFNQHLDMIQYLLRQDCSKELLKIGGANYAYQCSCLHLAAKSGNSTICSVLLAAGADPTILDSNGNTPAEVAQGAGHQQVSAELSRRFLFSKHHLFHPNLG